MLERDEHAAEWIRLAEKVAQLAPLSKGGRGNESGVRKAARELGIEKEDARRATKVAALSHEAKQVASEAKLDDNRRQRFLEAARPSEG
ncbi:hypothetical protein [Methylocystis sp.]|uniref:hypothetical protein n=1 Tax=Methylocystis sp. TaxID=1911079 RepID=UPI003DA21778